MQIKLLLIFSSLFVSTVAYSNQGVAVKNFVSVMGKGDYKDVARFLLRAGENFHINAMDEDGRTALHHAAMQGLITEIEFLLEIGADAKARSVKGRTPFDEAVDARELKTAAVLLKMMGGINGRDDKGWTPLNFAILSGDQDFVQSLLDEGAEVTNERRYQNSLEVAEMMEDGAMTELLRGHLLNPHHFVKAAKERRWLDMKLSLENGADPNWVDNFGNTALVWVVYWGGMRLVKLLLKYGADPSKANNRGDTAITLAEMDGAHGLADILRDAMDNERR